MVSRGGVVSSLLQPAINKAEVNNAAAEMGSSFFIRIFLAFSTDKNKISSVAENIRQENI
jgi:hypothetical protein